MRRHTITLGAATSAGGKVISASSAGSINGATIALESDVIFCPACKSQGKILCVGPRIPETWNGKQVALEDDLCACACPIPPKLIPNQNMRYQVIEAPAGTLTVASNAATGDICNLKTNRSNYDLVFVIQDQGTGLPLAGIPYKITLESGKTITGISDQQGRTQLVSSDVPETATLEAPYYDQDSTQTDGCFGYDACDC
jgi:uncharacterized Zn-binding protein involved in type VI secretion